MLIFSSLWFSINNQVRVNKVISGRAAIKPPNLSLRLATSLMNTTIAAVKRYLVTIQVIVLIPRGEDVKAILWKKC